MTDKELVKLLMRSRGWTQTKLAEELGVLRTSVVGYLGRGSAAMRVDTLLKMLNALGYDVIVRDRFSSKATEYTLDMVEQPDLLVETPKEKQTMRNAELLREYTPSILQKSMHLETNSVPESFREFGYYEWESLFKNAIEDLKNGAYVKGRAERSNPYYWEKQLELLRSLAPLG